MVFNASFNNIYIQTTVYKGHSMEPENDASIYMLKLCALFINVKNDSVLY